jgi:predicted aldo/keto reductase-like oxidoreductase
MRGQFYRDLAGKLETCDDCGQCEERCPFDLPVRDLLDESRRTLAQVLED